MNVGDRVEYYDPLIGKRITGTIYLRQKAYEHQGYVTYVRGDIPLGVTALHSGMNPVIVETRDEKSYREMVEAAMLRVKNMFGAVEL